ncbi:hypothetical protein IM660_06260 [Ruania alkalisoli]|uniref:Uncharacterized protein n=1 Tax=Ruania alkalisoli TaxID=2779775 RepID=A0A7M1SY09_9MICO|nr:hypothetical protein [Ruania alkalisoli]QOR71864.1 hypothetical protein IM660_06260 [Ruania alkalisoli]
MTDSSEYDPEDLPHSARVYVSAGRFDGQVVTVRSTAGAVEVTGENGALATITSGVEILKRPTPGSQRLRVFELPEVPESPFYGAVRYDFHGIPRWARTARTVWIVMLIIAVLTANGIFLGEIDLGVDAVWAAVAIAAIAALGVPLLLEIRATRKGMAQAEPVHAAIGVFERAGVPMENEASAGVHRGRLRSGQTLLPIVDYTLTRLTRSAAIAGAMLSGFVAYTLAFAPTAALAFGVSVLVDGPAARTARLISLLLAQPVAAALLWHVLQWGTAKTRFHPPLRERAAAYYRRPHLGTGLVFVLSLCATVPLALLAL